MSRGSTPLSTDASMAVKASVEQVLGVPVVEHAELRHAGADHGDAPAQLSSLFHFAAPVGYTTLRSRSFQ